MNKRQMVKNVKSLINKGGYELSKWDADLAAGHAHALKHEDVLAILFKTINPDSFFFVQIGANDGRMQDPLYCYIQKYSLRGLLVEPQPPVFETLKENYKSQPQLKFENCAIAKDEGEMTLYSFPEDLYFAEQDKNFSGFASFNKDHVIKGFNFHAPQVGLKGTAEDYLVTYQVPTMSFTDLLVKHKIDTVNYIQIDTEGFDFEVIKMIDFDRFIPDIIVYEHSGLSRSDKAASWAYLHERGYTCAVSGMDTLAYKI